MILRKNSMLGCWYVIGYGIIVGGISAIVTKYQVYEALGSLLCSHSDIDDHFALVTESDNFYSVNDACVS
jgi:hypothetical protein